MISALRELRDLCQGLASGTYPAFVTGGALGGEIPAFLYHRVETVQLDAHFAFLHRNGYGTLTADEHHAALAEPSPAGDRRVVVTFDDGLADLYHEAFPRMEKYGVHVVAFLIPARVGSAGMLTWDQIRLMHESGLVDFQSHSMHHVAIPISPEVVDFHHPRRRCYGAWDVPVGGAWQGGVPDFPPPLGFPIFRHGSRLGDAPRFVPSSEYEASFSRRVAQAGGEAFFKRRGWRAELRRLVRPIGDLSTIGRHEAPEEQHQAMRSELVLSRERIERELPGKIVRHLAYPWSVHGRRVEKLLEEFSYASAFAGLSPQPRGAGHPGRFALRRINGDFLGTLPGEGRVGIWSTLWFKALRRVTRGLPY